MTVVTCYSLVFPLPASVSLSVFLSLGFFGDPPPIPEVFLDTCEVAFL